MCLVSTFDEAPANPVIRTNLEVYPPYFFSSLPFIKILNSFRVRFSIVVNMNIANRYNGFLALEFCNTCSNYQDLSLQ